MNAYLTENAFMGLVLSVVEVYKKECLGLILGYKTPDRFVIQYPIPFQAAKKTYTKVAITERYQRRMRELIKEIPGLDLIGDFHSHPAYGGNKGDTSLSKEDLESMKNEEIALVIAINPNKKLQRWKINKNKTISGTLGDYHLKIACYYKKNGKGRPKKIPLLCPFVTGLT